MKLEKATQTPAEYSTACPYLMVDDVEAAMDYLAKLFGAIEKEKARDESGHIIHGEVVLGEVVIMLGRSRPEWPARKAMTYVFVEDVDQTYQSAIQLGSTTLMEPGDQEYGHREAGFEDLQGNQWWIARKN